MLPKLNVLLAVSGDSIDEDSMDTGIGANNANIVGHANRLHLHLVESTFTDNDNTEFVVQAAKPGSHTLRQSLTIPLQIPAWAGGTMTPRQQALSRRSGRANCSVSKFITVLTTSGGARKDAAQYRAVVTVTRGNTLDGRRFA